MLVLEFKDGVNCTDYTRKTPLHLACAKGHLDVSRVFTAKFNFTDSTGRTPLHLACAEWHLDVTKVLVSEFKAEVNHCLTVMAVARALASIMIS